MSKPNRLGGILRLSILAVGLAVGSSAIAQEWPAKPISLIVPFPTGGTTDVLARALGDELSKSLGQTVIVENRPGAGATIGADYVAKAKPDGYTLLMGAVHHTIATSVYNRLTYDFQKDLTPVSTMAMVPNVLVVNTERTQAKTVDELVTLAKASPVEFAYGSNGNGTAQHLIGTQFQTSTGVKLLHVPYRGSGPLTTDLLGGQVTMSFDTLTPVLPHIQAGKLTPLAVTTAKRASALPDTPTLQEVGLKDFDIGTWFGVLAPAGTPEAVVNRLYKDINTILASPDFQNRMRQQGAEPMMGSPEDFAKRIDEETKKFGELVRSANVKIE